MANPVDVNSLTLGELSFFEDYTGISMEALSDSERPKGKALSALVYLFKRREDPNFTLHDAEQMRLTEATEYLNLTAEVDDEEGKGDGSQK